MKFSLAGKTVAWYRYDSVADEDVLLGTPNSNEMDVSAEIQRRLHVDRDKVSRILESATKSVNMKIQ